MHIAISFIKQDGKFLLQGREFAAEKGGAGKIGCFGGKIERGETAAATASREVNEETDLKTQPADFQKIGEVSVISDHNLQIVHVQAEIFMLHIPADKTIVATEGVLVKLTEREVTANLPRMTAGTRAAFKKFILVGSK